MDKSYTIKEVAGMTNLSEHTLRFYEKQGLLIGVKRDKNGYRQFSDFDVAWIQFLVKIKKTSMSLKEIQKYALLMSQGNSTIVEREQILFDQKNRIEKQIAVLNDTLKLIDEKLGRYQRIKDDMGENDLEIFAKLQKQD